MRTRTGAVARFALAGGAALALVALVLPRASGARWHDIAAALSRPSAPQLALLGLLWFAGLCVHTPSLTAALPGLSHRRALLLNLSGSFVSNLLPLGGAAGTVVNWRMARTWGFSSGAFGRWAVVTNLADTVVKLALPESSCAGSPSARPHRHDRRDRRSGRGRTARGHPARGRPRGPRRPSAAARGTLGRPGRSASPQDPRGTGGLRRAGRAVPRRRRPAGPERVGSDARRQAGVRRTPGGAALGVPAGGRRPGRPPRRRVGLRRRARALHGRA